MAALGPIKRGIGRVAGGLVASLLGGLAPLFCALAETAPAPSPAASPMVSPLPSPPPMPADPLAAGSVLNVVLSLGLVLVAIWGAAWLMRRLSLIQAPVGGAMKMLGGLAVGQRERVVLVQVGETQLLLGVAPGRVRTLHVLDKPIEVAPPAGEGFAERLSQLMGERAAGRAARDRGEEAK